MKLAHDPGIRYRPTAKVSNFYISFSSSWNCDHMPEIQIVLFLFTGRWWNSRTLYSKCFIDCFCSFLFIYLLFFDFLVWCYFFVNHSSLIGTFAKNLSDFTLWLWLCHQRQHVGLFQTSTEDDPVWWWASYCRWQHLWGTALEGAITKTIILTIHLQMTTINYDYGNITLIWLFL